MLELRDGSKLQYDQDMFMKINKKDHDDDDDDDDDDNYVDDFNNFDDLDDFVLDHDGSCHVFILGKKHVEAESLDPFAVEV